MSPYLKVYCLVFTYIRFYIVVKYEMQKYIPVQFTQSFVIFILKNKFVYCLLTNV